MMFKAMALASYLTAGILVAVATDDWSMRCHGQHIAANGIRWGIVTTAVLGVPIMLGAAIVTMVWPHKPICETGLIP